MSQQIINGYVMADEFRSINQYYLPLGSVMISLFSCAFFILGITNESTSIPHFLASAIFMGIVICWLVLGYSYSKFICLSYFCEKDKITNMCALGKNSIYLNQSIYITTYPVKFSIKGTWNENFIILSNQPFMQIRDLDNNGLHVLKKLWKCGIIILPTNNQTLTWIKEIISIQQVPQYPRIAIIQKHNPNP